MTIHASRRDVLKGGGALVVSFSFAGNIGEALAQGSKPLALTEVDSFLAIDAGGEVTLYSGKVDLGTGVATALPQIVADELDVPLNRIKLIQGDTALTPDQGTTWGSLSVQIGGMQLRNAAATAKAALLEQAAKRLDAKKEDLKVADGVVSTGNKWVSYGELIGGKRFELTLDHTKPAAAKDPKDYKVVVEIADLAGCGEPVGRGARQQGRQGRGDEQRRQQRRGHCSGGRQDAESDVRLCHPYPWLDRSVLCGRRVQGRQADLLVGVPSNAQSAQATRHHARHTCR